MLPLTLSTRTSPKFTYFPVKFGQRNVSV